MLHKPKPLALHIEKVLLPRDSLQEQLGCLRGFTPRLVQSWLREPLLWQGLPQEYAQIAICGAGFSLPACLHVLVTPIFFSL